MPRPEIMNEFFDRRACGYDDHMRQTLAEGFDGFYASVVDPVEPTTEPIRVLDLGVGTGLELAGIWKRAPRAQITGIDVSQKMLAYLEQKYPQEEERLVLVQADYLVHPLSDGWDYIISVMSLHHLTPASKREFYGKIQRALKPQGRYIEGDYVVSLAEERRLLAEFSRSQLAQAEGRYHVDLPLSTVTQERLLKEAGFFEVRWIWQLGEAAVLVAETRESLNP